MQGQRSDTNPQLRRGTTELGKLCAEALREFGDFSPGSVNGDVGLMLLGFANNVIDEVRAHPYWPGERLDYYEHPTDNRQVPDNIVKAGVKYFYADQQGSSKTGPLGQAFIRTLNRELWYQLNGNTKIQVRPMDSPIQQDPVNGLEVASDDH